VISFSNTVMQREDKALAKAYQKTLRILGETTA
jgi:hypothetical protein